MSVFSSVFVCVKSSSHIHSFSRLYLISHCPSMSLFDIYMASCLLDVWNNKVLWPLVSMFSVFVTCPIKFSLFTNLVYQCLWDHLIVNPISSFYPVLFFAN